MVKASTWNELVGSDENTQLYCEESILLYNLKKLSLKSTILTNCEILYLGGQSTKTMMNLTLIIPESHSLTYCLRKYEKIYSFQIVLLRCLRFFHIFILRLNNYLKLITPKS